MLPGPPLAVPEPLESDETVPISWKPSGKRIAAFAPTNMPTMLLAPDDTFPVENDGSMNPKFTPTKPPATLFAPLPVTLEEVVESVILAKLMPARPPR